jgi:hypothetical protein
MCLRTPVEAECPVGEGAELCHEVRAAVAESGSLWSGSRRLRRLCGGWRRAAEALLRTCDIGVKKPDGHAFSVDRVH